MAKLSKFQRELRHRKKVVLAVLGLTEEAAAKKMHISLRRFQKVDTVDFGSAFKVSLDWLVCGSGANIKPHLSRPKGKVAILPMLGPADRVRRDIQHSRELAAKLMKLLTEHPDGPSAS